MPSLLFNGISSQYYRHRSHDLAVYGQPTRNRRHRFGSLPFVLTSWLCYPWSIWAWLSQPLLLRTTVPSSMTVFEKECATHYSSALLGPLYFAVILILGNRFFSESLSAKCQSNSAGLGSCLLHH